MNKNEKKCLISKLDEINEQINNNKNGILNIKKDDYLREWIEIDVILLNNQKVMIEQALINDFIEEL